MKINTDACLAATEETTPSLTAEDTALQRENELREAIGRLAGAQWKLDARRKHSAQAVDAASAAAKAVLEARDELNASAVEVGSALQHLCDGEVLCARSGYFVAARDSHGVPVARMLTPVLLMDLTLRIEQAQAAKGGEA
jgi:hypothetical protein